MDFDEGNRRCISSFTKDLEGDPEHYSNYLRLDLATFEELDRAKCVALFEKERHENEKCHFTS